MLFPLASHCLSSLSLFYEASPVASDHISRIFYDLQTRLNTCAISFASPSPCVWSSIKVADVCGQLSRSRTRCSVSLTSYISPDVVVSPAACGDPFFYFGRFPIFSSGLFRLSSWSTRRYQNHFLLVEANAPSFRRCTYIFLNRPSRCCPYWDEQLILPRPIMLRRN
ncbi:hypothetical protein BDZ97DRAFT_1113767 [Flammula alnicola]|nr:hypothetical protein BDZ97DRAFT_1113767 [Flammula alnicola]